MKASRGESGDEEAVLKDLDNGKIAMAGLDVFMGEPKPDERLLHHPKIQTSPHIGASTLEAQNKIGIELGKKMVAALLNKKG